MNSMDGFARAFSQLRSVQILTPESLGRLALVDAQFEPMPPQMFADRPR
jgi:hypothetical protein